MAFDLNQITLLIAGAIIVLALLIWLLIRANRKTRILGDDKEGSDVLDEGATPAARNQALIDAPEAVSPPQVPTPPEPVSVPEPVAAPATTGDDLRKIKGLGPKLVTLLAEQGITSFEQIAEWSDADIERIDATLGRFQGRIVRDKWVEQAKLLISGEESDFSAKFGNDG